MKNKTCGECKYFNPESTFDYPPNQNVRECTGGFYKGSFVAPDAPCCPDFKPKQTVFHQITASPEVLAEKFVYCNVTVKTIPSTSREQPGGVNITKGWYSTIIPDKVWSSESEAIFATVAKLKEVVK